MSGQTANFDGKLFFCIAALPVILFKLVVTASYFYVPYRLIWDGWVDYITDETGMFLTFFVAAPFMFDAVATNSAMMRRAYKLIYNQYYGDENFDTGLYAVDNDAAVVFDKPVFALEQRFCEVLPAT